MITIFLTTLEKCFASVVQISWQAAALVLIILAIQFLFQKHLAARWRYALWFLLMIRLVFPSLPTSALSCERLLRAPVDQISALPAFSSVMRPAPEATVREKSAANVAAAPLANPQGEKKRGISGAAVLAGLWFAGVLGFSLVLAVSHAAFLWSLRTARRYLESDPSFRLMVQCGEELKIRGRLRLLETLSVSTPAVCGILRPTLLVPMGFGNAFSLSEQRVIFLHEIAHIRRGDLLVNAAMAFFQVIHWFNPLIWLAFSRMRFDRECATDSFVLAGERVGLKSLYGHTLLKLVENLSQTPASPRLLGILEDKKRLSQRIRRIQHAAAGNYGWSVLGLVLLLGIGVVTLTESRATSAAPVEPVAATPKTSPVLPPGASKDEVRAYVQTVLKGSRGILSSSLKDQQIKDLKKVGPENIDVLIQENERLNVPMTQNVTANYYLSMAVCDLARPEDCALVVNALPKNRYLVYTIVKRKWAKEAREELLRVFRKEPGQFAPGWIDAIASLNDPTTYAELKNYLITGQHREYTYKALKKIPDIGDLKETVEKAWPLAENAGGYEARDMAKIAAEYGVESAVAYVKSHPDPKKSPVIDQRDQEMMVMVREGMDGAKLSAEQAEKLGQEIAEKPQDVNLRVKLLGYYLKNRQGGGAALTQILWIINNHPASPAAGSIYVQIPKPVQPAQYAEALEAWQKQVGAHPKDANVLGNAAAFMQLGTPLEAEKLYRQAVALEPGNIRWVEKLAAFYKLQTLRGPNPDFPHAAQEAFLAYEQALKGKEGANRFYILTSLAPAAYAANEFDKARAFAEELLQLAPSFPRDWNYGNAIFAANSVLGQLALQKGDKPAAEKYLLASGLTTGSSQLNSFGPEFGLAQSLLDAGADQTVIAFLGEVAVFWKGHEAQLTGWQEAIRKGEKPKLQRF